MQADPDWAMIHANLLHLHVEKSSGYGTGEDRLANFTAVSALSGDPGFLYPMRRSVEKLARCESLFRQGKYDALAEEFTDIASLMICAEAMRRRNNLNT